MMPYEVPVTQPGSAVHQKTSSGCRSSASRAVAWCATTASCTCTAPFGRPVVPLVKWSSAGVLGVGRRDRRTRRRRRAMSAARSWVPGDVGGPAPSPTSRTCSRSGRDAAQRLDLAAVERRASSRARARVAELEARADRLGPERGEQRREDAAVLERAEGGDVELRDASGQAADAVARADAERVQRVGEAARSARRARA